MGVLVHVELEGGVRPGGKEEVEGIRISGVAPPHGTRQALGKPESAELDAASISFTTTDVDAALCVSGVTLQQVGRDVWVGVVSTCPAFGRKSLTVPVTCLHRTA